MPPSLLTTLFRPAPLFSLAALLRLVLLLYGTWQDAHSAVKYTDIDYLVFTDAARSVSRGLSPYARETYRYTPLLAWLLVPTASPRLFSFGKVVFALADLLAGWLIVRVLRKQRGMSAERAGAFAAIWLWNPMVATISTRGSSEGLLGVLTMALLWAVEGRRIGVAGLILGLSVHFKIYPFIYAPAIIWWMDDEHLGKKKTSKPPAALAEAVLRLVSPERIKLTLISLSTFMGLNVLMYYMYVSSFSSFPPFFFPSPRHQSSTTATGNSLTPLSPATAPPFSPIPTSTTSPASTTATTSPRTTSTSTSPPPTRPPAPSMPSSPSCSSRASSSPLSSPRRISPRP
jgi:phosphatidylinositol glycan class M